MNFDIYLWTNSKFARKPISFCILLFNSIKGESKCNSRQIPQTFSIPLQIMSYKTCRAMREVCIWKLRIFTCTSCVKYAPKYRSFCNILKQEHEHSEKFKGLSHPTPLINIVAIKTVLSFVDDSPTEMGGRFLKDFRHTVKYTVERKLHIWRRVWRNRDSFSHIQNSLGY